MAERATRDLQWIPAVLLLLLVSFGVTLVAKDKVAQMHTAESKPKQTATKTTTTTPAPSESPLTKPVTTVQTPAATTATPAVKTATTNGSVAFRAAASTSSARLATLEAGTKVELTGEVQGQWQPAKVNGQTGFIYKTYLTY